MCKTIINDFIKGWTNKNYKLLYEISVLHMRIHSDKDGLIKMMKQTLLAQTVKSVEMLAIKETNDVFKTVLFKVEFLDGDVGDGMYAVNFIKEISPYKTSVDGKWGFNPISVRKYDKDDF